MKRIFGNGRYANVTATMALVVALGGTSYAAVALPKNSVGSGQIKKGAVAGSDIKKNAVTASKVKNGSLLAADFKAGQIPAGAKGDKGDKGDQGVPGVVGQTIVHRIDHTLADGQTTTTTQGNIACGPGEKPISGGANFDVIGHGDARITGSGPRSGTVDAPTVLNDGDAWTLWRATATNPAGGDANPVTLRVFIICATA